MSAISIGLCQCGCGQTTPITTRAWKKSGYIKGQPTRFISGHSPRSGTGTSYTGVGIGHGRGRKVVTTCRAIAEAVLGRQLPRSVQVHHVDENKRNDAHTNPVICQDQHFHRLLHIRRRVLKAGGNPNDQRICWSCHQLVLFKELVGFRNKPPSTIPSAPFLCQSCNYIRGVVWRSNAKKKSRAA